MDLNKVIAGSAAKHIEISDLPGHYSRLQMSWKFTSTLEITSVAGEIEGLRWLLTTRPRTVV